MMANSWALAHMKIQLLVQYVVHGYDFFFGRSDRLAVSHNSQVADASKRVSSGESEREYNTEEVWFSSPRRNRDTQPWRVSDFVKNYSAWVGVACGSRSPAECKKLSSPPASVKDSRTVGDMNKSGGRQHMVLMTAIPVGFSSD